MVTLSQNMNISITLKVFDNSKIIYEIKTSEEEVENYYFMV